MSDDKKPADGATLDDSDVEPDMREFLHEMSGASNPDLSDEDRQALAEHTKILVREFSRAMRLYQRRFTDLTSVQDIKKRWMAREISKNDPVFIIMELMAVCDARSQLTLDALTGVVHSFAQIAQIHAKRVSKAAEMLAATRAETARLYAETINARAQMKTLTNYLVEFAGTMPPLLKSMNTCYEAVSAGTKRAKMELMFLGAATFGAGLFVMYLLHRMGII